MKILKKIIILASLTMLINTNISAQRGLATATSIIDVEMEIMYNGKMAFSSVDANVDFEDTDSDPEDTDPPTPPCENPPCYDSTTQQMRIDGFTLEVWESKTTVPVKLAYRIYDDSEELLDGDESESTTESHVFSIARDTDVGDIMYIECGYINSNDKYIPDSGCTVVIDPSGITVTPGKP